MPLQPSPFLECLLRSLIPYFISATPDLQAARDEALQTLAAYGGRTRAELMNAVQVIILGFSTLETLCEASAGGMSPSMRLRFRGCANNLNRNGQKIEQTLMKRLARDVPKPTDLTAEPVNDIAQAEVEETLLQTQAAIDTTRAGLSGPRPAHTPPAQSSAVEQDEHLSGGTMIPSGMPVHGAPRPDLHSHSQRGSPH